MQADAASPLDRAGLVPCMVSSALLHQHLRRARPAGGELAETLYLLGACETHFAATSWVSEADLLLESAIRAAPASAVARRAFPTLEAHVVAGYTGSAGVHVPGDVADRLRSLRALAQGR